MTYLYLALIILGGLVAIGWLVSAVAEDLRTMERDDECDDIGGKPVMSDAEILKEMEKWRSGK